MSVTPPQSPHPRVAVPIGELAWGLGPGGASGCVGYMPLLASLPALSPRTSLGDPPRGAKNCKGGFCPSPRSPLGQAKLRILRNSKDPRRGPETLPTSVIRRIVSVGTIKFSALGVARRGKAVVGDVVRNFLGF